MSEYVTRILRDFSDNDLSRVITDGCAAQQRSDLTPPMIALRETWAVEASKELARRAELRRFARARELASEMILRNVEPQQMREVHAYAVQEAMALQ